MKKLILSAIIILFALSAPIAAGEEKIPENGEKKQEKATEKLELSLEEAVMLARKNNIGLKAGRLEVDIAAKDVFLAGAGFETYLSSSFTYSSAKGQSLINFGSFTMTYGQEGEKTETSSAMLGLSRKFIVGTELSLQLSQTRNSGPVQGLGIQSTSYAPGISLNLKQPLLRGFGKHYNTENIYYAEKAAQIAQQAYRNDINMLVNNVESAYWGLVAAREMAGVAKKSLEVARELEEKTSQLLEHGLVTEVELTQAKLNVAQRRQELIAARNSVENTRDGLLMLIKPGTENSEWDIEIEPTEKPEVTDQKINVNKAIEMAVKLRPEYRQLIHSRQIQSRKVRVSLLNTLPSFDITGSLSFSGIDERPESLANGSFVYGESPNPQDAWDNLLEGENRAWSLGATFSTSISRKAQEEAYRKAMLELDKVDMQLNEIKSLIVMQIRKAVRDIETARKQVEAAKLAEKLAEERLEAAKDKMEHGLLTNFEFQQHQEALDAARAGRIRAYIGYLVSLSAFEKATGTIGQKYGFDEPSE